MKRRKTKTRSYTFLLVPDDEKAAKSIKIKTFWLRFFAIFLIIILAAIIIGAASYWKVASLAIQYNSVLEENELLKNSLQKLENIKQEVERLKMMDQKLRSSLSGYVKIIENAENSQADQMPNGQFFEGSDADHRGLYNSIPEILPVEGFITRGLDSRLNSKNIHLGIDIASAKGTPVKATADGVVLFSGYTIDEGNVIILKHGFNFYSFYKHNLQNLVDGLEYVQKGQVIALLGDSGEISSGPHVHFEIWKDYKPVDPMIYVKDAEKYLK